MHSSSSGWPAVATSMQFSCKRFVVRHRVCVVPVGRLERLPAGQSMARRVVTLLGCGNVGADKVSHDMTVLSDVLCCWAAIVYRSDGHRHTFQDLITWWCAGTAYAARRCVQV